MTVTTVPRDVSAFTRQLRVSVLTTSQGPWNRAPSQWEIGWPNLGILKDTVTVGMDIKYGCVMQWRIHLNAKTRASVFHRPTRTTRPVRADANNVIVRIPKSKPVIKNQNGWKTVHNIKMANVGMGTVSSI